MKIEDFIKENKSKFDSQTLPDGHRERFLELLKDSGIVKENKNLSKKHSLRMIWSSVAAAAVVTATIVISGLNFKNDVTTKIPQIADNQLIELRHAYDKKVDDAIASLETVMANVDDSTRIQITQVIDNLTDMGDIFAEIAPLPEEKQMAIVEQIYDNRIKTIERISEKIKR